MDIFTIILLWFQNSIDVSGLIQTVGFPIAVALSLLFFAYKVYQSMAAQLSDKDTIIKEQIAYNKTFTNKIIDAQDKIFEVLGSRLDLLHKVLKLLETNTRMVRENQKELAKMKLEHTKEVQSRMIGK